MVPSNWRQQFQVFHPIYRLTANHFRREKRKEGKKAFAKWRAHVESDEKREAKIGNGRVGVTDSLRGEKWILMLHT